MTKPSKYDAAREEANACTNGNERGARLRWINRQEEGELVAALKRAQKRLDDFREQHAAARATRALRRQLKASLEATQ